MENKDATEQAYKNGYVDGYTDALNGKVRKDIVKIKCPICGKEMDETYLGRHYCYDCAKNVED